MVERFPRRASVPAGRVPARRSNQSLRFSSALAALSFRAKYELSPAVRLCSASPIPAAGAVRAPISDCVQNHSARTIPVNNSRSSRPCLWLVFSVSFIEGFSSSAHSQLFVERALRHLQRQSTRFAQIELSSPQIRKILDAHELVLPRPP